MKSTVKKLIVSALVFGVLPWTALADKFKNYEIRVIRERYFNKTSRYELGAQFTAVMNDAFVYSYLGTGLMGYHFNNSFALELSGSVGFSLEKEEKRILKDEFDVRTQIFRTCYSLEGALQYTPIY